jgi:hypothetical protein
MHKVTRSATLATALALLATSAHAADQASSYDELVRALTQGKHIVATFDLAQCTDPSTGAFGPAIKGGVAIDQFMVVERQFVAFANTHQTVQPSSNMPVTEFVRYRVKPDGAVTLDAFTINTIAGTALLKSAWTCQTGKSMRFVW